MKYPRMTWSRMQAIIDKLGGEKGVNTFLSSKPQPSSDSFWKEKDGVIYCTVTSDGTTGKEWIKRLHEKGFAPFQSLQNHVLLTNEFKATSGTIYLIAILRAERFSSENRTNEILAKAAAMNLKSPHPEVGCLLREKFSDYVLFKDMKLERIVTMHDPINECRIMIDAYSGYHSKDMKGQLILGGDQIHQDATGCAFIVAEV
jgi:hypothetical protein